ncbi:HEPN domain-containing protein [Patescibacteria group bacterium]|nr:HEPN domain-containing protein [Patescibacteria group bacterium]MBU4512135.1 HEPN domain-containing protein [Patescibacteria group bacterium]MCG2692508.1 HEPN domain-containing protein [Candidatus Parcubacteria bacterium]
MKLILKKWIEYAGADLDVAQRLFKSPRPTRWTYLLMFWHCHQVVEKMIKMVVVKKGKELLKIHDLPRLHQLADVEFSNQEKKFIDELNKYYLKPRYPDLIYKPLPKISRAQAKDYLQKTKKLFLCLKKQA